MSGELVLVSSIVTGGGAAVIVGGAAFLALRAVLKAQAAQADAALARTQVRIAAWETAQATLAQAQAELAAHQALWARTPLGHAAPAAPPPALTTPTTEDWRQASPATQTAWAAVQATLAALPPVASTDPQQPFAALHAQAAHLEAHLASQTPAQVAAFALTLQATVTAYHAEQAQRQQQQQAAQARAEALHQHLRRQQALLQQALPQAPVAALTALLTRLEQWQPGQWAELDQLEAEAAQLVPMLAQRLEQAAAQGVIAEAVDQILAELGYSPTQSFSPQAPSSAGHSLHARFQIPGGEQLRVHLGADLRLALQVVHERTTAAPGPLDTAEMRFWEQQEARWCADLPTFLAKLHATGIHYTVGFERHTPAHQIPLVVVESAADWEARHTPTATPHARHHP